MPHVTSQGCICSQEETRDLLVLWGKAKVLSQFEWSRCSNTCIDEDLSGRMQEHRHDWLMSQCHTKFKAFQAQWVTITNHNCQ